MRPRCSVGGVLDNCVLGADAERRSGEGRVRVAKARRKRALEGAIVIEVGAVDATLVCALLRFEAFCLHECDCCT
jgi:hypothetical protein